MSGVYVSPGDKVVKALEIAFQYSQIDGDHHKAWVLDQMVRALTGCPMVTVHKTDIHGTPYSFEDQGKSEAYLTFVRGHNNGEEGPDSYSWDEGIAP